MSQTLIVKIAGLYSFQNDLSAVPEGALSQADNIVIDRDSEAEPRRGFTFLAHGSSVQSQFSSASYRASKIFFYQNQTLAYYGAAGSPTILAYHDMTNGWTNYAGTFSPPSTTATMRSAQASQNFYFTTSKGVYKLDSYTGTPAAVGVPQGLDVTTSIGATVSPTATTVSGNATLTSVSSVTGVAIGMAVSGSGIPAGTYVASFNATTITLTQAATISASGVALSITVSSTWLATGTGSNTTAYRVLWGITDANKNLILGAPSQISQIANTTVSAAAVIVNFSVPAGITTSHFYQIYRPPAVASGITPNDEGQLVYQGSPVAADIAYGQISVLDIVPDSLRGATIYTAQSQQGLANQNSPPPLAQDIAVFRDCLFYANTATLQTYFLTLLGVGSPAGVQSGDTVTIGGIAYTADTVENSATGHFLVTSAFLLTTTTGTTTSGSTALTALSSTTGVTVGMAVSGAGIPTGTYVTVVVSGSAVTLSQAATASASGLAITFTGDSAAQAIRDTALSLVKVINRYASSTVYAYYLSGPNDLPGSILLQSRTVGAAAFRVVSSRGTCWNPVLPTSGVTQISSNSAAKNGIFYSKPSQPESVSLANTIPVGSADKAILRIIPLRDSLFVLKEDGIFRIYGTSSSNFSVSPLDNTANLIAPDTAVALNNQIYALTSQGVVSISETGVQIMSRAIEADLTSLTSLVDGNGASAYTTLQNSSFGVAYESSRSYYLFVLSGGTDTGPTQYYRYNTITNTWTHSSMSKACGGVNPADDKLYLGSSTARIVDVERKTLTFSDYADYQSTQTISAVNGAVLTITASDSIAVGSIIYQSATVFGTVLSVNSVSGTITMTQTIAFTNGSADILAPISCTVAWVPLAFANPGMSKQIREATFLFKADFNGTGQVGFTSDITPGVQTETIAGGNVGGFGLFGWGGPAETSFGTPWGGAPRRRPVRVAVPRNHQRCSVLTVSFSHAYGFSPWILQGLSVIGEISSERTNN